MEKSLLIIENGLRLYSDIHRCKQGTTAINNLQIDGDFKPRSVEGIKLTSELDDKAESNSMTIPSPKIDFKKDPKIRITHILSKNTPSIVIKLNWAKELVFIGRVDEKYNDSRKLIVSDLGKIVMIYFDEGDSSSKVIKRGLNLIINLIELIPPDGIGTMIDAISFLFKRMEVNEMRQDDIEKIKLILAHNLVLANIVDDPNRLDHLVLYASARYSETDLSVLLKLIGMIDLNSNMPLQYYMSFLEDDSSYLINLFVILENENLIQLVRPGEIKKIDNEELLYFLDLKD